LAILFSLPVSLFLAEIFGTSLAGYLNIRNNNIINQ
jgi:hypothetical protein